MKLKGKKVLITGADGFIGSHLTEALAGQGYRVTVLDDLSSERLANIDYVFRLAALKETLRWFDVR